MNRIQIDYNYQANPSDDMMICWKDLPAIMRRPPGMQAQMQTSQVAAAATGRQICKINADPTNTDRTLGPIIHIQHHYSNYNMN